jgi:hypothetical protein
LHPRRQKNHLRESQREHQVPEPPLAKRSISNKESGGLRERTPSLRSISNKESGGLHERTPSLRSISNKEREGPPERTPSLRIISNKEWEGLPERTPSLRSISNKERGGPLALIPQNIPKINNPDEIQPCVFYFNFVILPH